MLESSVSINFILPTTLVVVVNPSAVSRFTNVGISGTLNNMLLLMIMSVAELSIIIVMRSVSNKKGSLLWSYAVESYLAYRVVIGMNFARRHITCRTSTFLLSLAKIEAKMDLDQCRIKPLAI